MSYCLNPQCQKPQNSKNTHKCSACGTQLLLKKRYRAIEAIGQGNFGRTLLAIDESKPEKFFCVIKQFLPQAQGTNNLEKAAELFEQEALRLKKLGRHNQIPDLFDYLAQEEHQYLVQEYIDGYNLADILKEQRIFQEQQIWELLNNLLPVLEFIHKNDVIHRDIKPENIIRDKNGKLYLVDFGAAKVVTGTAILQTGTSIGTPEFVAPEQSMGKAIYSSDLYSLGVTCIHLLTGTSPFDLFDISEYSWVWRQYLVDNLVSEGLANILDKLIESATSRRYQVASEVLGDINHKSLNNTRLEKRLHPTNWKEFYNFQAKIKNKEDYDFINTDTITISSDGSIVAIIAYYINGMKNFSLGVNKIYTLQLWNIHTGTKILYTENKSYINTVAISRDKKIVAIGDRDNNIKLWNIDSGNEIYHFKGWHGAINCVSFSPDSQLIASGGDDTTVKLWDITTGSEIRTLKGDNKSVRIIAFAPNGEILASVSTDAKITLWNLNTGKILHTQQNSHTLGINSITFSPDGKIFATANRKKCIIKLWEVATGKEIATLKSTKSPANVITFSPEGKILASGNKNGKIQLWDINTKQEICTISKDYSQINSLIFRQERKTQTLITANAYGIISKFRNMNKSYGLTTQKYYWQCTNIFSHHNDDIDSITINNDGIIIASGSHDNTIKLWDTITGKELKNIDTKYSIYAIAFSPDGLTIASGDAKNNIYLWDVNSGDKIRIFEGHTGRFAGVNSLSFSPDGRILASAGGDKTVKLWDVTTGAEIRTLAEHKRWVSSVHFSPDGNIIASGSADNTAKFWDVSTGQILNTFEHTNEVRSVTFSPNGKIFATGSNDRDIKLWQVENGKEICTLKGHELSVRYITFDPSGEILASSSYNDDIKLWDIVLQKEIFSLEGYSDKVNSIVFSPDGEALFSGSDDKKIKVWQKQYFMGDNH